MVINRIRKILDVSHKILKPVNSFKRKQWQQFLHVFFRSWDLSIDRTEYDKAVITHTYISFYVIDSKQAYTRTVTIHMQLSQLILTFKKY